MKNGKANTHTQRNRGKFMTFSNRQREHTVGLGLL